MTEVYGRAAFITGGANGIGLAIARALAREGVKLGLVDIDVEALGRAKQELCELTAVETAVLDMRDRAGFEPVADALEEAIGPISLVINNAGVAGGAPADRITYELWDWNLGINLQGPISGIQTFLPRMMARGRGGHIVNTASAAGLAASNSGVLYHTAKYAVVGLSEALQLELGAVGIGVSVLCPGPVSTGIVRRTRALQPSVVKSMTPEQHTAARALNADMAKWLEKGTSPGAVGQMVLDAIRADQLYIHTDRSMAPLIEARCEAILNAMPA